MCARLDFAEKGKGREIDADVFVFTTPFSHVRTRKFNFELGRGKKEKGGKCTAASERTSKKSRNVILGGDSNAQLMR